MNVISFNIETPLLTKEEINTLPMILYEGEIILVSNQEQLEAALPHLAKENVLGFDTETRPTFTKGTNYPPSLLQLSTNNTVFLIQLNHIIFNHELTNLLASEHIIKAGVAINDDLNALAKIYNFKPAGMVDLATMANKKGLKAQGLRTITANLLGHRVSKNAQCSNWSHHQLTKKQIKYAATDAWLGRILYEALDGLPTIINLPENPLKLKKKRKQYKPYKQTKNNPIENAPNNILIETTLPLF